MLRPASVSDPPNVPLVIDIVLAGLRHMFIRIPARWQSHLRQNRIIPSQVHQECWSTSCKFLSSPHSVNVFWMITSFTVGTRGWLKSLQDLSQAGQLYTFAHACFLKIWWQDYSRFGTSRHVVCLQAFLRPRKNSRTVDFCQTGRGWGPQGLTSYGRLSSYCLLMCINLEWIVTWNISRRSWRLSACPKTCRTG